MRLPFLEMTDKYFLYFKIFSNVNFSIINRKQCHNKITHTFITTIVYLLKLGDVVSFLQYSQIFLNFMFFFSNNYYKSLYQTNPNPTIQGLLVILISVLQQMQCQGFNFLLRLCKQSLHKTYLSNKAHQVLSPLAFVMFSKQQ